MKGWAAKGSAASVRRVERILIEVGDGKEVNGGGSLLGARA